MIENRIGEVAAARGIDTKTLSKRADIAYNTALNLIRGVVTKIDLVVLDKVCEALDAEPGELLVRVRPSAAPRREERHLPGKSEAQP